MSDRACPSAGECAPALRSEYDSFGVPGSLVGGSSRVEENVTRPDSAPKLHPRAIRAGRRPLLPTWRRDALRTTLWVVPAGLVVLVVLVFPLTYALDRAVSRGDISLPAWIDAAASPDAGRQVLIAIAAAVITVIGVVFSITILALTLASQQFGPRMLRNFVRDIGTQLTLGIFVATFVYAVLALGSITSGPGQAFVPHVSITVALMLLVVDLIVLIYFIHHIARSIQLPEVIASIARDLSKAIDQEYPRADSERVSVVPSAFGTSVRHLREILVQEGATVRAIASGYLQFVGRDQLVAIAQGANGVIRLVHRPGHFVVAGGPLATVWPATAAPAVREGLAAAHITGAHRTLLQDPVFAIDQLVEIAIRALSPAVNDTFTALTCIDWLASGLSRIAARGTTDGLYLDRNGQVRLIEPPTDFERVLGRAFDKIRQAGRGMPAVAIRLMSAIRGVLEHTTTEQQRQLLMRQAEMVMRGGEEAIPEPNDLADLRERYDLVISTTEGLASAPGPGVRPA
jgi:uncharacterized membrane protein